MEWKPQGHASSIGMGCRCGAWGQAEGLLAQQHFLCSLESTHIGYPCTRSLGCMLAVDGKAGQMYCRP